MEEAKGAASVLHANRGMGGGLEPGAEMVPPPHPALGASEEPRLGTRPLRHGASTPGPTCSPNPADLSPHLTRLLGILDLHGVGQRGEGQFPVRRTEGSGGDSGGGWAAREGPASSSPQTGRGGPRAGRRRLRRGPAQGAAPPPRRGAARTQRAGEGRRPRRSGPPHSRSEQ